MAYDIGPKIGIDGEAEFRKSINAINQNIKTLGTEMAAVTSAYDKNDKSTANLTAQNEVLNKQITAQKEKLEKLNEGLAECTKKYGENDEKSLKWQAAVNTATAELNKMERQLAENNQALEDTGDGINDVSKNLDDAGSAGIKFGDILKANILSDAIISGVKALASAVTDFVKGTIDVGSQFDVSMSQVAATMGTTVDQIQELRDFAMEMGANTAFSASQAADALNYMALAGYDAEQSMEMLPNVLNLAASGSMELAAASDMITDSQTALGLTFEETSILVDQMAKAASTTNTSVSQMGDAILTVGGTAKNLAGGTKELNAVLGVLADNSIKGSEAGTHLRNIMLAMTPTTDAAVAAFEKLNLSSYDSEGNLRALSDIFADLSTALADYTDEEKTLILSDMFNKTDLASVNALLSTSAERWGEVYGAIENASGAAEAMAATQLDNLTGDITLFQSALEGAQIVISDQLTPTLRQFVQFGSEAISRLSTAFQEGGLSGAMEELGTVISDGLAMIMEMLPDMIEAGGQLLGSLIEGIIQNLPLLVEGAADIILTLASGITESLPEMIPTIVDIVLQIVETLIDNVDMLVDAAIEIIVALAEGLINALPTLLEKAPEIVENLVTAIVENAPKLLDSAWELIQSLARGIIDNLPEIGQAAIDIVNTVIDGVGDLWEDIKGVGKNIVNGIWEGIKGMAKWLKNKVTGFFSDVVGGVKDFLGIKSPSKVFAGIGGYMAEGLGVGFGKEIPDVQRRIDRSMNELVNSASGYTVPVQAAGAATSNGGQSPSGTDLAEAIKSAMAGMGVYLGDRQVGEIVTSRQRNKARASGAMVMTY